MAHDAFQQYLWFWGCLAEDELPKGHICFPLLLLVFLFLGINLIIFLWRTSFSGKIHLLFCVLVSTWADRDLVLGLHALDETFWEDGCFLKWENTFMVSFMHSFSFFLPLVVFHRCLDSLTGGRGWLSWASINVDRGRWWCKNLNCLLPVTGRIFEENHWI